MKPTWIPTVTGRKAAPYAVVLCSPSARWSMIRGRSHTIVDCHTYYLRKRRNVQAAVAHYLHHLEFLKAHADDDSLTFISVDYDWLPRPAREALRGVYADNLDHSRYRWLAIPETDEFKAIDDPVGFAVTPQTPPELWHPQWTHCLSKVIVHQPQCQVWTYDSVSPNGD